MKLPSKVQAWRSYYETCLSSQPEELFNIFQDPATEKDNLAQNILDI